MWFCLNCAHHVELAVPSCWHKSGNWGHGQWLGSFSWVIVVGTGVLVAGDSVSSDRAARDAGLKV